jgi:hypothetical protein
MDKITVSKFIDFDGQECEQVTIDHGNDQFTSMLKSTYDEQQAANEAQAK